MHIKYMYYIIKNIFHIMILKMIFNLHQYLFFLKIIQKFIYIKLSKSTININIIDIISTIILYFSV